MKPARLASRLSVHFLVWMCFLLRVASFHVGADVSLERTSHLVRAAFVSIADDDDLAAISTSIRQLEATFNYEYQYHWVFFSSKPLGEHFRRVTSNATRAVCLYEVVSPEHWLSEAPLVPPTESSDQVDDVKSIAALRLHRPGPGSFALEHRMKDYDWFWRVEPGTLFHHHIPFDVFRFMCDNGIAYSLTKSAVQTLHLQSLSSKVNLLIDENPGLAHAEPDVSWSTEAAEDELMWSKSGSPDQSIKDKEKEGSHPKPCLVCTDSRQNKRVKWSYQGTSASVHNSDDAGEFLHRSLCVGLSCPDFEMGSLAFLRNPSHRALINYLTQSSTPPHSDFADDVHADFLSATMLLLKQRVWNLHKRMFHHEVNTPTPLPSPPQASARSPHEAAMLEQLYRWSHIAQDFLRQSISPGLQSGNTVVDERNFALL